MSYVLPADPGKGNHARWTAWFAKVLAGFALVALVASCGSSAETSTAVAEAPAEVVTAVTAVDEQPATDDDDHEDGDHDDDDHDDDDHEDEDHEDEDHEDDDHEDEDHEDEDHEDDDHDDEVHDDADHDHDDDDGAETGTTTTTAASEATSASAPAVAVANASYLESYTLVDEGFGTQVTVVVDGDTRTIESNTLPNHETGDFPNAGNPNTISEQDRSWTLTTSPVVTDRATPVRETGVALNGVKFEPGTAESTECSSGETYRIEGLQDMFDLGMDFNNAHVQPTGEYHYHGVSELLVEAFDSDEDLVLVGFAADGHMMYYSKSSAYTSSYSLSTTPRSGTDCAYRGTDVDLDGTTPDGTFVSDWVYTAGQGDLDECNGTMIGDEYAYVITEDYPYIPRCLMGEVNETAPGGGGAAPDGAAPGGALPEAGGADQAGPPDLTDAAAALGLTEAELQELFGGSPPNVAGAAEALGMTEAELMAILDEFGVAPPAS